MAALLVSCSGNSDETKPDVKPEKIPIRVAMGIGTRATDTAFENGDKAGVYAVNYNGATPGTLATSGNHLNNMGIALNGTAWTPDAPSYWQDETTPVDFYCYYPYVASPSSVTAYPFSVSTDQSVVSNYKASDFLWGKTAGVTPTASTIQITVKHVMSNVLVYLQPGSGFTTQTLAAATKSVTICNTKPASTIDFATGAATATGSVAEIKTSVESGYYRALIVPQTVAAGSDLVKITIDGKDYILKQGITFEGNKQHSCTITVNKTGQGVNIGIGNWETDPIDHGGAAE